MQLDLIIRNGAIVDGTGLAAYRADVGIRRGRIVSLGRLRESARIELDAEGHVVTPGFIDGHTHMDAQLFWDPHGASSCWHGVTTAVIGNCGFTLAPARPHARELVVRNLERAEDISGEAIAQGVNWTWSDFSEYLDAVEATPKGINYAANIGHSAMRTWAMGERAFEGPATAADVEAMERELRVAIKAGAIGFTTSRSDQHNTTDDRPVASRLADWSEVRHLVGVMGDLGAGIFELANEPATRSPDKAVRDEYHRRLRDLAVETRVPITFGVLGGYSDDQFELMDSIAAAGGRMFGMSHSRGVSVLTSFQTHLPFDVLTEWRPFRAMPLDEQKRALRDPSFRQKLVDAAVHGDYGNPVGSEPPKPKYDTIQVLDSPLPPNPVLAELAGQQGKHPVEVMIDLALAADFNQFFIQPLSANDRDTLISLMKNPRTVMTFSDAGAHVSQVMDNSIQTHLLAYWVRDQEVFTLEEAVRMLTLAPARAWGFSDRGLVREGMIADLNVIDPKRVGPEMPTVAKDLPGGALRIKQTSTGILATIVGGEIVLKNGQPTGAMPGRLIRGPRYAS
jgi:N-acyl-D-aspartate/D-glutamate deacylase